jgi:hypothetical protein
VARELSLDVPGDISVAGFDDVRIAAVGSPPRWRRASRASPRLTTARVD